MTTVTVSPSYRTRDDKARAPARLATTMLEVVVAGAADSSRFQRGRAYARDGAVVVLHVSTGRLEAEVAGSRSSEYEVRIDVLLAPGAPTEPTAGPAALIRLVPEPDDLRYSCTCPDIAEPCKHGVAAMLAFAAEIGERPDLLRLWRVGPTPRARIGAGKAAMDSAEPDEPVARRAPPVARWQTPPWQTYLGTDASALHAAESAAGVRALMPPLPATAHEAVGGFDVTAFVDSARAAIRRVVDREQRSTR